MEFLPIDSSQVVLATIAIFIGTAVQGTFGIGSALVAAPLLLLVNPVFVPAPVIAANVLLTALMLRKEWRAVNYREFALVFAGRVVGTLPAVVILALASSLLFDLLFGSMILVAVLLSALGRRVAISKVSLLGAGFASGLMGTLSSIGGPPVALLYQHSESLRFRATMSMLMLSGGTASLLLVGLGIGFVREQLIAAAVLTPGVLLGFLLSRLAVGRVTDKGIRWVVLGLSAMGAMAVLLRAVASAMH